jgi:hypothetical protein
MKGCNLWGLLVFLPAKFKSFSIGIFCMTRILFSAFLFAASSLWNPAYSYKPPIGIPDPGVEWSGLHPIDTNAPARPSRWTNQVNDFYYVDPSNSNATDTDNTYGFPGRPRITVPSILAAGSYVELHGPITNPIGLTAKCSADKPCWVRGESSENRPNISSEMNISDSTYLFIENLDFNGGTGGAVGISGASSNVVFRSSRIINRIQPDGATSGIGIIPDHGDLMENIVIFGNHFESLGDYTVDVDRDFHAIVPSLWGRDSSTELRKVFILENYCTLLSGDCVQVNAGNWHESYNYLHHVYIGKNVSFKNRQAGFGIKQSSDVIISQNKSSGSYGDTGGNAGGAIGYQYPKHRLWIIFNELFDSVYGIRQSDTAATSEGYSNIYIIGNLIYDIHPTNISTYDPKNPWSQGAGIALWHGNSNRYIVDNTIHDVHDAIIGIYSGGVEMFGNIVSQKDDNIYNRFFDFAHPARNDLVKMNYNLFIDDTSERYFAWWNGMDDADSLDTVKSYGHCLECKAIIGVDSTDQFINPTTNPGTRDFRLKSLSQAISGNKKHPVYDTFKSLYGMDIYVDFNAVPRKISASAIGAFEYNTGKHPPSPPVLLLTDSQQ